MSLVEDADAVIATSTALALGGGALAGAAGVAVLDYVLDTEDPDQDDLEYSIYNAASAAAENRDVFESSVNTKWSGVNAQQTPYAEAAWSTVRAEVVGARSDGLSKIPCCTFKINSPDGTVKPESGSVVMNRTEMLLSI